MYYDTEQPLPGGDFEHLCRRVLAVSDSEKTAVRSLLNEFFTLDGDVYRNGRCDEEILIYKGKQATAIKAGKASAQSRLNQRSTGVKRALRSGSTNQEPRTSNQEPINTPASAAPRGKRPIPDGWKPKPETLTGLSTELKIDASAYVPAFIDSCLAKDYRYKDFEAAFRKCVRDDWPKLRQVNGKPVSTLQPVDKKCACGTSLRFGSTDGLCNPCWRLKTYGAAEARA